MKKLTVTLVSATLALLISICGCSGSNVSPSTAGSSPTTAPSAGKSDDKIKMIFHTPTAENSINHKAAIYLKELLETGSNGQIQMEIYTGGALFGGDRETLEAMQRGDCTFSIIATAPYVMFEPKAAVFDIPFLFDAQTDMMATMDTVETFLTSDAGKAAIAPVFADLPNVGMKPLAYANQGFREVTANKEIRTVEDFKGLKIRTMENKYHMEAWKLLGANPTPMAFNEVFTALEQKTIDAQENPYELICTSKFYEVQPYVINTHHIASIHIFGCSQKVFDSLSPELQTLVSDSVEKVARNYAQEAKTSLQEKESIILDAGNTIINIDPAEYQRFRDTTAPVVDMLRADLGEDLVNNLMASVEATK